MSVGPDCGGCRSFMIPDFDRYNTISKLFWYYVNEHADDITLWSKQRAAWESLTWREYGEWSWDIGNALLACGMNKGDKVSILSQTRLEWVVCDMAIMGIGCVTAPIYHSNTEEQVLYIAEHSDSRLAFVEDQEQLDKMLTIWDKLPQIERIVVFDKYVPKNLPNVTSFSDFMEMGVHYREEHPNIFEDRIEAGDPEDIISFIYTSGTTGYPKAGIINSRNVIALSLIHI